MNKKQSISCLTAALTLSLACIPASISAKKTTITYWEKWEGAQQKIMLNMINKFNKSQNKIEVKYVYEPNAAYEKFLTACAAGNPPDIVGGWNHRLAPYVLYEIAEPLDKYLKSMKLSKDSFITAYWDMMTFKGKVYEIPLTPACFATYWNKTMFAEVGHPEVGPTTLEEIMAMNEKLTKKGPNGRAKQIGYSPTIRGYYPYWWPVAFGADLVDEVKGIIDLSQPGCLNAMEWVRKMSVQLGGSVGVAGVTSGFRQFKTAIDLFGSWNPSRISIEAPSLKYGIGDLPYGRSGSKWSWLEADVLFMPKAGKHNKEAAQFMGR